jgi:threonine synthase
MSGLIGLRCPECGKEVSASVPQTTCSACDSPLLAQYDLPRVARELSADAVSRRPAGLWRWAELLPVRDPQCRVTLGEGDTPMLPAERLGQSLGLRWLWIKDEGANPTGTFKARGMAVAVSKARELGLHALVVPSAGNAGGALAAYAARAGLEAHVFMPADVPHGNRAEVAAAAAELHPVQGLIDEAGRQAAQGASEHNWFDVSTFREPYRVEGKKTMGYELAEEFGWDPPEVVIYPTGGGTGLVGLWKAFRELAELGWIEARMPRLMCVQPEGCAPVVQALQAGADRARPWPNPVTSAPGLRVPRPYADRLILRSVRESRGEGLAVSEDEIQDARRDLAHQAGVLAAPEGAATLAGLRRLVAAGRVEADERVVLLNTGTGLKTLP